MSGINNNLIFLRNQRIMTQSPVDKLAEQKIEEKADTQNVPVPTEDTDTTISFMAIIELRTSLRKAKILQLKWEDIDFENKSIKIVKIQKGKPVPETLPLTKDAEESLLNLPRLSEYVFTNTKTGTAFTTIYKGFSNALKNANIENFIFHDLRRTVGTRMLKSGANIRTVQQQLGHTRVTTTERYTQPDIEERRQAVEKLDSYGKDNNNDKLMSMRNNMFHIKWFTYNSHRKR